MSRLLPLILMISTCALAAPKDKNLENFFSDKTKIENPLELRDPFKPPQFKSEGEKKGWSSSGKGQYSNIGESKLDTLIVHEIKVVGVMIGKERRALINASEAQKEVIVLKEGMKIGPDGAELKAILPGGIVLVEKIVNVYGQEEYLETVIPISR